MLNMYVSCSHREMNEPKKAAMQPETTTLMWFVVYQEIQ